MLLSTKETRYFYLDNFAYYYTYCVLVITFFRLRIHFFTDIFFNNSFSITKNHLTDKGFAFDLLFPKVKKKKMKEMSVIIFNIGNSDKD